MEEPEQIDFKESEECGPELFVSGYGTAACSFEYCHELQKLHKIYEFVDKLGE